MERLSQAQRFAIFVMVFKTLCFLNYKRIYLGNYKPRMLLQRCVLEMSRLISIKHAIIMCITNARQSHQRTVLEEELYRNLHVTFLGQVQTYLLVSKVETPGPLRAPLVTKDSTAALVGILHNFGFDLIERILGANLCLE